MNHSKVVIVVNNIIGFFQWVFGIFFTIFSMLALLVCITGKMKFENAYMTIIVFLGIGIPLLLAGKKKRTSVKDFKKYVQHLSIVPGGYISDLAESTGESVDMVNKKLNYMIQRKYFANAHINKSENRIIIGNRGMADIIESSGNLQYVKETNKAIHNKIPNDIEFVSVKCPNCGGNNKVELRKIAECDYCGSSIKGI